MKTINDYIAPTRYAERIEIPNRDFTGLEILVDPQKLEYRIPESNTLQVAYTLSDFLTRLGVINLAFLLSTNEYEESAIIQEYGPKEAEVKHFETIAILSLHNRNLVRGMCLPETLQYMGVCDLLTDSPQDLISVTFYPLGTHLIRQEEVTRFFDQYVKVLDDDQR